MTATATPIARSAPIQRSDRPVFQAQSPFRTEVTRRVEEYFKKTGLDEKGGAPMVTKTVTILAWAVASYVLLVFFATSVWTAVPLAISLGLAFAGVGFSIMHDGGHGAYSHKSWVNRLAVATNDLIGASSYFWHQKHDIVHHTFTNIEGVDEDIIAAPFLRLSPAQPRYWFHRFQHWYFMPLLVFFVPKWIFFDDTKYWITGKVASVKVPTPRGWDAVQLVAGKLVAITLWYVIPFALHPPLEAFLFGTLASWTMGMALGLVFQLAHVVEGACYENPPADGEKFARPFFEHQLATTADFAPRNPIVNWYVGGLNFQAVHHLFPRIGHRHYPAIREIVRDTAREYGVLYNCHDTFMKALAAHIRTVRGLGRGEPLFQPPLPLPLALSTR